MDEYLGAVKEDVTLQTWRLHGDKGEKGFRLEAGVLKRSVKDGLQVSRNVVVMPESLRRRMFEVVP